MQISRLQLISLYDLYDYDISFNNDDNQMTILTGPNGYGKTTILRILNSLKAKYLYYFYTIKYRQIVISFSDKTILKITQKYEGKIEAETNADRKENQDKEVRFTWEKEDGQVFSQFVYNKNNINNAINSFQFRFSYIEEGFESYTDKTREDKLLDNEKFNEIIAHSNGHSQFLMQLEALRSFYIPSNRIYNEAHQENELLPIEKIRNHLTEILKAAQREYLLYSQKVDSNFIKSVLTSSGVECTKEVYLDLKSEVERSLDILVDYKLASKVDIPDYNEGNKAVLFAYLNGLKQKFGKYTDTLKKLNLFNEMLTAKRFANKSILFSPNHGFVIRSTNGDTLKEYQLSSGEQNEIVLLYRLVFEVPDQSLLLIDEPENSLHVAWQKMIVEDMQRIADTKQVQVIMATHSPTIVSKGKTFTKDLYYLMH